MLLRTDRHLPAVQLSVSISLNLCIHVFSQYLKFNVSLNTSLIIPSAYTYPPSCLTTVNKSCDWSIQSSIVLPLLLNRFLHITKCISLNCKAKMHLSLNMTQFRPCFPFSRIFCPFWAKVPSAPCCMLPPHLSQPLSPDYLAFCTSFCISIFGICICIIFVFVLWYFFGCFISKTLVLFEIVSISLPQSCCWHGNVVFSSFIFLISTCLYFLSACLHQIFPNASDQISLALFCTFRGMRACAGLTSRSLQSNLGNTNLIRSHQFPLSLSLSYSHIVIYSHI